MKTARSPGAASHRPRPGARSGTVPLKRQPGDPSDYLRRLQSRPSRIHRQRALNDRAIKGLFFLSLTRLITRPLAILFFVVVVLSLAPLSGKPGQMRPRYGRESRGRKTVTCNIPSGRRRSPDEERGRREKEGEEEEEEESCFVESFGDVHLPPGK